MSCSVQRQSRHGPAAGWPYTEAQSTYQRARRGPGSGALRRKEEGDDQRKRSSFDAVTAKAPGFHSNSSRASTSHLRRGKRGAARGEGARWPIVSSVITETFLLQTKRENTQELKAQSTSYSLVHQTCSGASRGARILCGEKL